MHGTSEMHMDKMVAWKIVIERDGKKLEFTNASTFDSMNKRAKPGAQADNWNESRRVARSGSCHLSEKK